MNRYITGIPLWINACLLSHLHCGWMWLPDTSWAWEMVEWVENQILLFQRHPHFDMSEDGPSTIFGCSWRTLESDYSHFVLEVDKSRRANQHHLRARSRPGCHREFSRSCLAVMLKVNNGILRALENNNNNRNLRFSKTFKELFPISDMNGRHPFPAMRSPCGWVLSTSQKKPIQLPLSYSPPYFQSEPSSFLPSNNWTTMGICRTSLSFGVHWGTNLMWAEGSLNPNTELTICVKPAQTAQGGCFSHASNVHGGFHPHNIGPSTFVRKFHYLWRFRAKIDQITRTTIIKLDQKI